MQVSSSIEIARPKADVWQVITDIDNSANIISSIIKIDVLEKPDVDLVGFKWKETRKMYGKEATEVMWVTDAVENEYYSTRAESHGSVYISRLSLTESGSNTLLTMSFSGEAQSVMAKIFSTLMGFMIKGSIEKELHKDLVDIRNYFAQS